MVALYQMITGLMLASAVMAIPVKDARDGRLFFPAPSPAAKPAVGQPNQRNQFIYLLPTELTTGPPASADPRWMWGHIKKCRVCPDSAKPAPHYALSSLSPHAMKPFNWGWSMEASWNAWTRPWSTWGFLPIHLLPCCPKPNPPPRPITPTTPVPITTAPTTVATTERVQFVTVEFITDSTTDPTDSPPTTISPPTPEVQPTQLPTTEKVQPTLPTTEKVQPTSLPTTEKVQASTLPVTEDVQLDDSTDDPSDAIPNTVIKYESPLVEISSNEYLPVQNEPDSAQHASSANLGAKHRDGALIFPLISPQLLDNMTPELTTTTPAKTMTSDAATNVQSNSAINDAMTDPMAEKVPMLISPLPVNSAIDGDSAIVKKPSGFSDSTEEDLMDGGLIPNVPLTKSPKDETNIDMTQLIELGDMLTQLKRSGEIKDGDSLPPESIPLKGLKLFMNLYPPSYISFLRR